MAAPRLLCASGLRSCGVPRTGGAGGRGARRRPVAAAGRSDEWTFAQFQASGEAPMEGDVVLFAREGAAPGYAFGLLAELAEGPDAQPVARVELLGCQRSEESARLHLHPTARFLTLRCGDLAFVDYTYEERMDTDRVSNPHGEHAHGFYVPLVELPPQCIEYDEQ